MLSNLVRRLFGCEFFDGNISGVAIDSRQVRPGDLFFALSGEATDGHKYLSHIAEKGGVAAVIRKDYQGPVPSNLLAIRVEDPLKSLQDMAKARVSEVGAHIVAITGSVGKTTTKEFVRTLFETTFSVTSTTGNHNSQIGMSMSLLNNIRGDEGWLIIEMGMSGEGQIRTLIDIVPPDIALITAVAPVHMVHFERTEQIARAKAEIFERPGTEWDLYNADTMHVDVMRQVGSGKKRSFSIKGNKEALWTLERVLGGISIAEDGASIYLPCKPFPAAHVDENLLAAIAAARTAGISWEAIAQGLPALSMPKGRLEVSCNQGVTFINDAYNASEMSMLSALDVLCGHAPARRIAVLGQMMELGSLSEVCHGRVGEKAVASADLLFCLGNGCEPIVQRWRGAGGSCLWTSSLDELIEQIRREVRSGDVVLLKGSHSNRLWKVVESFERGSDV